MALVIEKVIESAIPIVRTDNNVVKHWEISIKFTDKTSGWSRTYDQHINVEESNLTVDQYTKEKILELISPSLDVVFKAHYDAHNVEAPPTEERLSTFNFNDLK